LKLSTAIQYMSAEPSAQMDPASLESKVGSFAIDSREVEAGGLFFALSQPEYRENGFNGEFQDSTRYVPSAIERGALAARQYPVAVRARAGVASGIEAVGVGTADGATVEIDGYQLHTALDTKQLTAIAEATGGHYRAAPDAEQLDDVASTIDLRLTVAKQDVPLAGGFIAMALVLLALGALLTGVRTGRLL